jgi:hypothetical protein
MLLTGPDGWTYLTTGARDGILNGDVESGVLTIGRRHDDGDSLQEPVPVLHDVDRRTSSMGDLMAGEKIVISTVSYVNLSAMGWTVEDVEELAEDLHVTFGDAQHTLVYLKDVVDLIDARNKADSHAEWDGRLMALVELVDVGCLFVDLEGAW